MSAIISACGLYRYRLERECAPDGQVFAYFGINPSTADASLDDATVRKWRGFTIRNGGRRFLVANLFAYRSTDPKALKDLADPFGPDAWNHLHRVITDADVLVPCWGSLSKIPANLRRVPEQVMKFLLASGKPVVCFGKTSCGQPKHPLMLSYSTQLTLWD